jgi:DDE superfamily endonuclease
MAHFLRRLSDEKYPTAAAIVLVMDNLNIHALSWLYEAFEPREARRLVQRFEVHHTPRRGSWLNAAEIFLSILSRECLDQRIADPSYMRAIVAALQTSRPSARVSSRSKTADARIKLRRLFPSIP